MINCCLQRKERLLKKQHRQALLLDNFVSVDGLAPGRSLRDRKPVTYTFGKRNLLILCIVLNLTNDSIKIKNEVYREIHFVLAQAFSSQLFSQRT